MSRSAKLNLFLALVVVGVFALNWTLEPTTTRSNYEFLPGMLYPVPTESFTASPVFDDGVAMRTPPAGTIARGRPPLHFGATPEEAERAGRELANPFAQPQQDAHREHREHREMVERGQAVYAIYCQLCHGPGGEGDGIVAQRGFPAPPSMLAANARKMADGRLFHIVTHGQANMPGHATQIEPADRWKTILWVRQLQAEAATEPISGEEVGR